MTTANLANAIGQFGNQAFSLVGRRTALARRGRGGGAGPIPDGAEGFPRQGRNVEDSDGLLHSVDEIEDPDRFVPEIAAPQLIVNGIEPDARLLRLVIREGERTGRIDGDPREIEGNRRHVLLGIPPELTLGHHFAVLDGILVEEVRHLSIELEQQPASGLVLAMETDDADDARDFLGAPLVGKTAKRGERGW